MFFVIPKKRISKNMIAFPIIHTKKGIIAYQINSDNALWSS